MDRLDTPKANTPLTHRLFFIRYADTHSAKTVDDKQRLVGTVVIVRITCYFEVLKFLHIFRGDASLIGSRFEG